MFVDFFFSKVPQLFNVIYQASVFASDYSAEKKNGNASKFCSALYVKVQASLTKNKQWITQHKMSEANLFDAEGLNFAGLAFFCCNCKCCAGAQRGTDTGLSLKRHFQQDFPD